MKGDGPLLIVDAGNALFKAPGLNEKADRARAQLIFSAMAKMGTVAMAVGARDLNAGPAWLKDQAGLHKQLKLLSANLTDASGKLLFAPSAIIEVGGKKVALIGVSPASSAKKGGPDFLGGAKGLPITAAVVAEAKKLRAQSELIVVLAAVPYADSLQLSREAGSAVDFIIQSHEGRGQGAAQRGEGNILMPGGERGRMLGKLTLDLGKSGPFVDLQEIERDRQTLSILETQLGEVKGRLDKATDEGAKAQLARTLGQFKERQRQVKARLAVASKAGGRQMNLEWIPLSPELNADPAMDAEVKKIEPHGAAH